MPCLTSTATTRRCRSRPSRGFELPADISSTIDDALASEQIGYKASERIDNRLLYRFNSAQDQVAAANALQKRSVTTTSSR